MTYNCRESIDTVIWTGGWNPQELLAGGWNWLAGWLVQLQHQPAKFSPAEQAADLIWSSAIWEHRVTHRLTLDRQAIDRFCYLQPITLKWVSDSAISGVSASNSQWVPFQLQLIISHQTLRDATDPPIKLPFLSSLKYQVKISLCNLLRVLMSVRYEVIQLLCNPLQEDMSNLFLLSEYVNRMFAWS